MLDRYCNKACTLQCSLTLALLAEERRLEQQAVEDRAMAVETVGRPAPLIPDPVREQISGGQIDDARLSQLEEAISEEDGDVEENRSEQSGDSDGNRHTQEHSDTQNMSLERYMAVLSLDEGRPAVECVVCIQHLSRISDDGVGLRRHLVPTLPYTNLPRCDAQRGHVASQVLPSRDLCYRSPANPRRRLAPSIRSQINRVEHDRSNLLL